tara:strand:- start:369 stop:578 length:210 start_codon:yes stop_codon:yes gene_type:complete
MSDKKFKGIIEYNLTIIYDSDKDEIKDISESAVRLDTGVTHHYGDIVLDDYWDEEWEEKLKHIPEVGEA